MNLFLVEAIGCGPRGLASTMHDSIGAPELVINQTSSQSMWVVFSFLGGRTSKYPSSYNPHSRMPLGQRQGRSEQPSTHDFGFDLTRKSTNKESTYLWSWLSGPPALIFGATSAVEIDVFRSSNK